MTIPRTNKFALITYFSHFRFQDLISALGESNNYSWVNGFFAPTLGESTNCPQILYALELAGFQFSDSETWNEAIESQFLFNRGERRLTRLFWSFIINYLTADVDTKEPFKQFQDDSSLWLAAIVRFWAYFEARFGSNLLKTAQAYFQKEYDPLENYNGEETYSRDTATNTNMTTSGSSSVNIDGFNSDESSPQTDGESSSTTSGDAEDNTFHEEITRNRHGNLGVTTSQQMLQSELDLRRYDFTEYFYSLWDKILLSAIY